MNAIDVISAVRCPRCKKTRTPLDGSIWSLNNSGHLKIECVCGYALSAMVKVEHVSDNSTELKVTTTFGTLAGGGRRA